jgi:hypothetical protein
MKTQPRRLSVHVLPLVLCAVATLAPQVHGACGIPLWTNRYNGPGNASDVANAMIVDTNGNIVVTGFSGGIGSVSDYATIKYSNSGVPLWTNRYNGPANDSDVATAAAVDGVGNVFVTGSSYGIGSYIDYATIKYSGTGVPLWTNRYGGPGDSLDEPTAVVVDGSGSVIVTGRAVQVIQGVFVNAATTIKYSAEGVPLWTNRNMGPGNVGYLVNAIASDSNGNIVLTGCSGSATEYLTIKYSSGGMALWTNRYAGSGSTANNARALTVDLNGDIIVAGYTVTSGSSSDFATIKYSSAGTPMWTNRYNGPANGYDDAVALAVDAGGDVVVTGYSEGIGSSGDYATIKYSGAGLPLWTNRYNGPANSDDYPAGATGSSSRFALAKDSGGNAFVTGGSGGDYATVAYSSAGVPLWTNRFNGSGNGWDEGHAVAVDGDGNTFVTGLSPGPGTGNDYATIKYSTSIVPAPFLSFRRVNGQLVLSWTNAGFVLQAAPIIPGTFTNIPGATSPHTNTFTGAQQFFRLISN